MGPGGLKPGSYDATKLSQDQRNWLFNYFGHSGQAPVGYGGESTGNDGSTPDAGSATAAYNAAIGSATGFLNTAGTNLDTQYSDLLNKVLGVGSQAMNTATLGENNLLASRGITNNSPLYSREMTYAQLPVTSQVQGALGTLGYNQAQQKLALAGNIAGLVAGGAGTAAGLPLSYGSLALANAANIANISYLGSQAAQAGAAARYIPIPNVGLYDVQGGSFVGGITNTNLTTGGYQITGVSPNNSKTTINNNSGAGVNNASNLSS